MSAPSKDRLRCGQCGDDLLLEELEGHLASEGRQTQSMAALTKINDIRDSIIGHQNGNWSLHIYPLVSALNAAGMKGLDYEEARGRLSEIDRRILDTHEKDTRPPRKPNAAAT